MKTRIISILLACVMLLALVPSLVLAADEGGNEKHIFLEEFLAEDAGFSYDVSEYFANKGKDPNNEPIRTNAEYEAWLKDEAFKVNQGNSNWKVGEFVTSNGSFVPFARLLFMAYDTAEGHDVNWASTEEIYQKLLANFITNGYVTDGNTSIWNGAALWHLHAGSEDKANTGFVPGNTTVLPGKVTTSGTDFATAIQYTVPAAGAYGVSLDGYETPAGHLLAIAFNGEIVFPADADATKTNTWFATGEQTPLLMINTLLGSLSFEAEAGDTISFLIGGKGDSCHINPVVSQNGGSTGSDVPNAYFIVREDGVALSTTLVEGDTIELPAYTGSKIFLGWDVTGDGKVDYMPGTVLSLSEFSSALIYADAVSVGSSSFARHYPKLDAEGYPSFSGGWEIGCYFKKEATYLPFVGKADDSGIITIDDNTGVWTGKGGGFYAGAEQTGLNPVTGCMPNEEYLGEIRYTVPYGGQVEFSMDEILCKRQGATQPSKISYSFAVYVNGEKVWPTTLGMFSVVSEETYDNAIVDYDAKADFAAAGFPLQLNVKSGDVISFRTQEANDQCWVIKASPCVTYTSINESPVAMGSSVTLRADRVDLDLNFYAHIINARENAAVGMEYWLTDPTDAMLAEGGTQMEGVLDENGFYRFTYGGFSAKQMADLIYVRPYSVVGEDKVYGNVVAYSIQQYAMGAMGMNEKLDNLLIALLNYGSHAQDYFEYKIDNLANAGLTEDQKTMTVDLNTLTDVYENAEGDNKITNVSLLLGNELGMKYMINSVEGATTYELEYSKNADFTEATKIPMTGVWENRQQKAIYYIGLGEVDDTFYVRAVVDGVPGATLTYSVESYILRMQMCKDVYMWHTINGLGFLGQAIEAYQA